MLVATLVEGIVSRVVLDESEIAIEGGGVRLLVSSCLLVEVLAKGNMGNGAGRDRRGWSISSTVSRAAMRCLRARMRSSTCDLQGHEVGTRERGGRGQTSKGRGI